MRDRSLRAVNKPFRKRPEGHRGLRRKSERSEQCEDDPVLGTDCQGTYQAHRASGKGAGGHAAAGVVHTSARQPAETLTARRCHRGRPPGAELKTQGRLAELAPGQLRLASSTSMQAEIDRWIES